MKALFALLLAATSVAHGAAENVDAGAKHDRARGVFQAFLLSERSVKFLPGQMDLNWSDIPALLELGAAAKVVDAKRYTFGRMYMTAVPTAPLPSQGQSQAVEGMVALWMLEGLRCGQGAAFRPPLMAYCTRGSLGQTECEISADIHRDVLAAYRRWWDRVKNLTAEDAAAKDPLAGSGLQWTGGQSVEAVHSEPSVTPESVAKAAAPAVGLPDPPFTVEEVAAYHRKTTGSSLSAEMLKRLYTSKAINDYSQQGDRSGLLDDARRALAFEQEEPTLLMLYSRLMDGYFFQKGSPLAQQRMKAAKVALVALRTTLAHELPDVRPELPGVGRYDVHGSKELEEAAEKKHRAQMEARQKAEEIVTLVDFRQQFTQRLVSEYGYRERTPQALDELHDLAAQYLGDEKAARQLRAAAEGYKGSSDPELILRIAKP